jgi:hypothetical protein
MSAPRELQELVGEIARAYPSAHIDFDPLPSGVCFLWATVADRNFVMEYDPKRGVGVSENTAETPAFVGHDEVYPTLTVGIERYKAMLAEAARNEAASVYVLHDKKTEQTN